MSQFVEQESLLTDTALTGSGVHFHIEEGDFAGAGVNRVLVAPERLEEARELISQILGRDCTE